MLHPGAKQREPFVATQLKGTEGVLVAASDYVKALPESVSQWMPRPLIALGTDGFGRSESRASLRDFFAVDAKHIVLATLTGLLRDGKIKAAEVKKAISELGIDAERPDPFTV
jgi:pyruvate dehydrogenase E1 component